MGWPPRAQPLQRGWSADQLPRLDHVRSKKLAKRGHTGRYDGTQGNLSRVGAAKRMDILTPSRPERAVREGPQMIGAVRGLEVASFLFVVLLSQVQAQPQPHPPKPLNIVGYCKAHGTVDYPPNVGFGASDGGLPPELVAVEANKWRCLDGKVLVCADTADGDQCGRKDANRNPPTLIEECRGAPDGKTLSFAASHFSRFDWACKGGRPVILRSYELDRRSFFRKAWARLVVSHGVVISPKTPPAILR